MVANQNQQIKIPPTLVWAVIAFFAVQTLGGIGAFYKLETRVSVCERVDEGVIKKIDAIDAKIESKFEKVYDLLIGGH